MDGERARTATSETRPPFGAWLVSAVFVSAVFLSAFLIFQVQPLVGRRILPWFGGTAAVWTTCLLVFQALLCVGYGYAHVLGRWPIRRQAAIHVALLLAAAFMPITPDVGWKPAGGEDPQVRIVGMLLSGVGLPYLALAATGPLLQSWFWRVLPQRSPYPLYALSNAGSLLALLSYPTLFEPWLTGSQQAATWRVGFGVFAALCSTAAWLTSSRLGSARTEPTPTDDPQTPVRPRRQWEGLLWVGWSACGVVLFMSVTNQLTLNIAAVPFLWVLPLGIYLATFIVAFSGLRVYSRRRFAGLFVVSIAGVLAMLQADIQYALSEGWRLEAGYQIAGYSAALSVLCMGCQGELYALRPGPERLTAFYFANACGGALGGLIVGLLAPMQFLLYQEVHLALLSFAGLMLATAFGDPARRRAGGRPSWAAGIAFAGATALGAVIVAQTTSLLDGMTTSRRNFFGLLRVQDSFPDEPRRSVRRLWDGSTLHGYQFQDPERKGSPTSYYTAGTGGGAALGLYPSDGGRHIGVIGLGIGTLAAYGRPDDRLRFYEINPAVVDIATSEFDYLGTTRASWEIVLGDARLQLQAEAPQAFDLLVVDAFSSDSVPVHLLTVEAFAAYERHLRPDGALVIHVSNLHLDLSSLVHSVAAQRGLQALEIRNRMDPARGTLPARWVVLSRSPAFLQRLARRFAADQRAGRVGLSRGAQRSVAVWTDDYSNLLQLLR